MNIINKRLLSATVTIAVSASLVFSMASNAQPAKSEKHAAKATELRQSVFKLIRSNMAPLGGMAKGKIPLDVSVVEKNALRINQLSLMIADYSRVNTSKYSVETEALDKIWKEPELYAKATEKLTQASSALITAAKTNDQATIKKAIGAVGKSCGGCHDDFKKD